MKLKIFLSIISVISVTNSFASPLSPETFQALQEAQDSNSYNLKIMQITRPTTADFSVTTQTLVILGEEHLKDLPSKELGRKIVSGFRLIGIEGVRFSDIDNEELINDFLTANYKKFFYASPKERLTLERAFAESTLGSTLHPHETDNQNPQAPQTSTTHDARNQFQSIFEAFSEEQREKFRLLNYSFEGHSEFFLSPYREVHPQRITVSSIKNDRIRSFYEKLGINPDSQYQLNEIYHQLQTIRQSLIGDGSEVISLEFYEDTPKEVLKIEDYVIKLICGSTAAIGAVSVSALSFCMSGYLPAGSQPYIQTGSAFALTAAVGYCRGWLNCVLPTPLQMPQIDVKKLITERDPILANQADMSLKLRDESVDHMLVIVRKAHTPGLVRILTEKGYEPIALDEFYSQSLRSTPH